MSGSQRVPVLWEAGWVRYRHNEWPFLRRDLVVISERELRETIVALRRLIKGEQSKKLAGRVAKAS